MNKTRANKLSPFAERIDEWAAEGKTLAEMQAGLKDDGCQVALSSLSEFLSRRRSAAMERDLFERIANGAAMNRHLDAVYLENPDPAIERLIQVVKTNTMTLQVQGAANPKLLQLANSMLQTVLNYLTGKTKADLEARKLGLGERRVAVLEMRMGEARAQLQKLRDPNAQLSEAERKAIVDKVDEVLGLK